MNDPNAAFVVVDNRDFTAVVIVLRSRHRCRLQKPSIPSDALSMRGRTMIQLDNIQPLTDFKRNTSGFRQKLKKSGLPTVLTVDGRAELVVQDAAAYQKLLDAVDRAEAIEGIHRGLESMKQGKVRPASEFFAELRRKQKPRRKAG